MTYEGQFRDFMVGWLADQLTNPDMTREQVKAAYDAVVCAGDDGEALFEVSAALGDTIAQKLFGLSHFWRDPTVDRAREMIEALREQAQQGRRDPTDFYLFFLNPFKEGCVPDGYEDQIEREICWMFELLYGVAGQAVLAATGWKPEVVVEPSYEGASDIIVLAHPTADYLDKIFLLHHWHKAWQVRFANLTELAQELLALREVMEQTVPKAILGYHLAQTATRVMGQGGTTVTARISASPPPAAPVEPQSLAAFTDRVADVVTDLNGLTGSIVNEEITGADFNDDLTGLFAKLNQVEGAVSELADLFWPSA